MLLLAGAAQAEFEVRIDGLPDAPAPIGSPFSPQYSIWVDCLDGLGDLESATATVEIAPGHEAVDVQYAEQINFAWPPCDGPPRRVHAADIPFTLVVPANTPPPANTPLTLSVDVAMHERTIGAAQQAQDAAEWRVGLLPRVTLQLTGPVSGELGAPLDVPLVLQSGSNGPLTVSLRDSQHQEQFALEAGARHEFQWPMAAAADLLVLNASVSDPQVPGVVLWAQDYTFPVAVHAPSVVEAPGVPIPALALVLALVLAARRPANR